jgi:hypothetical protein
MLTMAIAPDRVIRTRRFYRDFTQRLKLRQMNGVFLHPRHSLLAALLTID